MRPSHSVLFFASLVALAGCGAADSDGSDELTGTASAIGSARRPDSVTQLELPGAAFYPQSIVAARDGTLFAAGAGTGEVVRYAAGATQAQVIVPQANPPIVVPGLAVDVHTNTLYVCADHFGPNFTMPVAELRAYDFDGHLQHTYPLPQPGTTLCEDATVDRHGNVYITDAFNGVVYVLDKATGTISQWASSPLLRPGTVPVPPFGAHGLALDGRGNLYVSNFNTSDLVRIPINHDGSAGTPVRLTVTPAITNPEAIRMVDAHHMLLVEDIWASPDGRLTELTIADDDTATSTVLRQGLRGPTSLAVADDSYWITEGQVSNLIAGTMPSLPFLVLRQPRH